MLALLARSLVLGIVGAAWLTPLCVAAQDAVTARVRWQAAAIQDYEYSYQRSCECHPDNLADTIVTVTDGNVVAVRYARADYARDVPVAEDRLIWFRTIEDLFALLENAAASDATVRATFDPEHGYPTTVYVDYVTDLVGDEVDLKITAFRSLEAVVPGSG